MNVGNKFRKGEIVVYYGKPFEILDYNWVLTGQVRIRKIGKKMNYTVKESDLQKIDIKTYYSKFK